MIRTRLAAVALFFCLQTALIGGTAQAPATAGLKIEVTVIDQSRLPVPAAQVQLKQRDGIVSSISTDESGHAVFSGLKPGRYSLEAVKDGFDPVSKNDFEVSASGPGAIEFTIVPSAAKKVSVEVTDTVAPVEQGSTTPTTVSALEAKDSPVRPTTVSDALPLLPGVMRQPGGGLQLSGSGEHRSALIVNSADVTDPATGQFGLTVPMDSVESLNFYQTSFLAEYGRFTAGLVSVETRRGSDKWKWELNDPFPEFNIRSWHLRGLRTATPRLNFEGPLIANKLFFSEGFEYVDRKTAVFTLPFPNNQKKQEGLNSFAQLDWVASGKNLVTATIHIAPQRLGYVNMNYFNPQPTTPDATTHNYTGTISDKYTIFGGLWENTFSATKFDANVWAKGPADFVIQPQGNSGDYFAGQSRDAERYGWTSSFSFAPWEKWGSHSYKIGAYAAGSYDDGRVLEHPIDVMDASGGLLERIAFTGGSAFDNADTEYAFYAQDHWIITPHVAIDLGLRVESQEISETIRFAPRFGIAWSPFTGLGTVIRAGTGMFYDRVPLGVYSFNQYPDRVVTLYDGNGQILQGPTLYQNGLGEVISRQSLIYRELQAGNFSPNSKTGSIQLEQPVTKFVRLRAGYMQTVSSGLVMLDSTLPDPTTNIAQTLLSGNGTARYHQYEISARVRAGDKRELMFSYVRSRSTGDLNDFANYIGSFPAPIIHANQVATSPMDIPNRFLAWGTLHLPRGFGIAPVFEYRSGTPYVVTNALQRYVGIPNSTRYPTFLSADARVWRDFQVSSKYSIRISVSSFNLTNHFNPEAIHWNTADPAYGLFFGERHRRFTADFDVNF
ncbi:MAG: carboxypeptidase regulatory-like domain-containing protein [Bryobacteraceae bacterium]|nr:carboxypeptidase regulatory-like domain-containing protein [Bryobacteraceae bacterium]